MAGKANVIKTVNDLTAKQRRFVEIYVANFGYISKTEAARQEQGKYANKLRSFKRLEKFGDTAANKNQFASAINAEFRSGQLAGMYVDKKEVTHNTLEGMSREQLEKRLSELEKKIGEGKNIIDVTPEAITKKS